MIASGKVSCWHNPSSTHCYYVLRAIYCAVSEGLCMHVVVQGRFYHHNPNFADVDTQAQGNTSEPRRLKLYFSLILKTALLLHLLH